MQTSYGVAGHLIRVLLGWFLATVAGSIFMLLAFRIPRLQRESIGELLIAFPTFLPLFIVTTALITLIPGAVIVVAGEIMSIRRWYFYCVCGMLAGVCGVLSPLQMSIWAGVRWRWQNISIEQFTNWPMMMIALGGALSGLVYWAIAGCHAGFRAAGTPAAR